MLSVIIPTLGRSHELRETLRILAGEAEGLIREVMVIVDGPACQIDPDIEYVIGTRKMTVVRMHAHVGASACRNTGARLASGEFLAFLDDDVHVLPGWSEAVCNAIRSDFVAVTGPVKARDAGIVSEARELRYRQRYLGLRDGDRVSFLAGGNAIIRRDTFMALGGFPEGLVATDSGFGQLLSTTPAAVRFLWGMGVSHRHNRGVFTAMKCAWLAGRENRWRPDQKVTAGPAIAPNLSPRRLAVSVLNLLLWCIHRTARLLPARP